MNQAIRYPGLALVLIAVLLSAATPAVAGTARQLALGGDGGYLEDAADVLRWYADLGDYPDRLVFELGDPLSDREDALGDRARLGHGGGAHVRLDEDGRWGTAAFYLQDHLQEEGLEGAFTALWARRFGSVDVGLNGRFTTYGRSSEGTDAGDGIDTRYIHQYGIGLRTELREGLRVECASELINSRIESGGALWWLDADDWTSFGWRTRAFVTLSDEAVLVPLIDHDRDQRSLVSDVIGGPADRDAHMTAYGLGLRLQRDPRTTIVISAEYRSGKEELRYLNDPDLVADWTLSKRDFFQIRGRAQVETAPYPWLILRGALSYVRVRDDVDRTSPGSAYASSSDIEERFVGVVAPLSFGIGVRYGDLEVDLAWNDARPANSGLADEGLYLGEDCAGYSAVSVGWGF